MDELEAYGNSIEFVNQLMKLRKYYEEITNIANDNTYSKQERREAKEITKDGYHSFVGKLNKINNNE